MVKILEINFNEKINEINITNVNSYIKKLNKKY